ncbi:MAG TPA: VWA domain-containing protein [Acidobacteriota bacterium]|nr:VWA domain-containing protein [Acidobacteriota bacterium]
MRNEDCGLRNEQFFQTLTALFLCFLCLGAFTATLFGQNPSNSAPPPATANERFRAVTHLVTVDVVVTGKKGQSVMNLKSEDFRIFEDNVPQTLEFLLVDRTGEHRPALTSTHTGSMGPSRVETPQTAYLQGEAASHSIVLLLDYSTTTVANQKLVREGARKYIAKHLDGQDQLAIFAFDSRLRTLQSFTRDKEKLSEALRYSGSRGDAVAGEHEALSLGASQSVDKQDKLTQKIGNLLGSAAAGAPAAMIVPALAAAQAELDMARYAELQFYSLKSSLDDQLSRSVLLAIQAIADGLQLVPGRKTLVLLSQGFAVPPNVRQILESTLAASIRSNTAIYAVDTRGLESEAPIFQTSQLESISPLQRGTRTRVVNGESQFDRAAMIGTDQEESLLRFLSNSTGGFYQHNSNDLSQGLAHIDKDLHARYLLAYSSTNKKMDGAFRNIRVEVVPKGLKVRARKGYFALP